MTPSRIAFVCSCEDTMDLDGKALARGCASQGAELRGAEQLCRAQLDRFLSALGEGRPVTVACTQEAPLFSQEAEEAGFTQRLDFVNVREQAGWSREGRDAGPKMAALLAGAAVAMPPTKLVTLESGGVLLILGRDGSAIEAGRALMDKLDVTVLLDGSVEVQPPFRADFPGDARPRPHGERLAGQLHRGAGGLCRPLAVLARRLCLGPGARRRGKPLRRHPRPVRPPGAVPDA
jgi:hypothetical protein